MPKPPGRLTTALLETAGHMRRVGATDAATHARITRRHFGDKAIAEREAKLRVALVQGEDSGASIPFDFDAFLARKKTPPPQ
ncbi:type II toxin-antitoxin system ParD family antitoxin [Humitalea sp. 24SJ18S-53]|uniref:type II toxin-antitoxin system ParD family antitoxin n=1 Tax=Humitalea sp. 24SJ18S-53 TaxID=3422307 RepID=UPI003D667280